MAYYTSLLTLTRGLILGHFTQKGNPVKLNGSIHTNKANRIWLVMV